MDIVRMGDSVMMTNAGHISDHDLERYALGTITDESQLAPLEEHLLICPECLERAQESDVYTDAIRYALV
jgi:hypothetical protein